MAIKNLLLFILMLIPMSTWAQGIATANQAAIDECAKAGGQMTSFTAGKCELQRCKYADNKSDGKFYRVGDNSRTNCSDAEIKKELDKIATDLNINVNNGNGGTTANANGGTTANGNGGTTANANGGTTANANGGTTANANGGTTANANGGVTAGVADGSGSYPCDWLKSKVMPGNHPCAHACRNRLIGKDGSKNKKCKECMEKYSVENHGDLEIDWSKVPGGRPNKSSVGGLEGVEVRVEKICYDLKTGAIVSRTKVAPGSDTECLPGSSTTPPNGRVGTAGSVTISTPGAGTGSGSATGTGAVTVNTAGVSGSASLELPAACKSKKKADKAYCDSWIRAQARFACSSSAHAADCIGAESVADIQASIDRDCPGGICRGAKAKDNSWIGEGIAGLAIGAGNALSAYFTGKAYTKSQEAWADASVKTAEQCTIDKENYRQYTISQELTAITPDQQAAMGCNGYNLGGYAGLGSSGLGAWTGGGYSPGYLNGQLGPYGGYNPYGYGNVGGAVGGIVAGMNGGYINGAVNGGGIIAGMNGGYVAGMNGGYVAGMNGGYVAGMNGGYINGAVNGGGYVAGMNGGYVAGMNGGYINGAVNGGGYVAGMNGGYINGAVNGGGYVSGMNGGYVAGMNGGYINGAVNGGGYVSGMNGGYVNGAVNGGYVVAGGNGGYNNGGYYPGGWGSGTAQYPQANYWQASQGTSNYDRALQNQGISYQMGMGSGGYGGGGYTAASFNPMNAGGAFNANFNLGLGY